MDFYIGCTLQYVSFKIIIRQGRARLKLRPCIRFLAGKRVGLLMVILYSRFKSLKKSYFLIYF